MKEVMDYATGIQHVGIPCKSIEETKEFYEKLGFYIKHEKTIRDGKQKVCFLEYMGLVLECYEDEVALKAGAIDHIAIDVNDIEGCYALCKEQGYTIVSDGIEQLPFYDKGVRFFIILGPNNERLEFNEIL